MLRYGQRKPGAGRGFGRGAFRLSADWVSSQARSVQGWLFKILCASCKRYYTENEKKKSVVYLDDENRGFDEPSVLDDLDISIELRNALQALAPDEREIVLLSVVSDYKSHEIAEILDCPSSTVRSKLKRSLEKLRRRMGGDT